MYCNTLRFVSEFDESLLWSEKRERVKSKLGKNGGSGWWWGGLADAGEFSEDVMGRIE